MKRKILHPSSSPNASGSQPHEVITSQSSKSCNTGHNRLGGSVCHDSHVDVNIGSNSSVSCYHDQNSMKTTESMSTLPDSRVVNCKRRGRLSALRDISNVVENLDNKFSSYTTVGELHFRNSVVKRRSGRFLAFENYDPNIAQLSSIYEKDHSDATTKEGENSSRCITGLSAHSPQVPRGISHVWENHLPADKTIQGVASGRQIPPTHSLSRTSNASFGTGRHEAIGSMRGIERGMQSQPLVIESCDVRYKSLHFSFDANPNEENNEDDEDTDLPQGNSKADFGGQPGNDEGTLSDYVDEGDASYICQSCSVRMWLNEKVGNSSSVSKVLKSFSLCCLKGKVQLPLMLAPPEQLFKLFFDTSMPASKNFHANIRSYNNMFSFTSMGGKIDHSKNCGAGPYTFVLSGMNHHNIGSLLPPEGQRPVFSQLYIYDTDNEVTNHISAINKHVKESSVDPEIVEQIRNVLDDVNPFVKQYRVASSMIKDVLHSDIKLCLISSRHQDGRNYSLPSTSDVAALIVGDIDMNFSRRDVIIHELSRAPQRIDELHPSYLPLQYPILFPRGEDGYREDIEHREETLISTKKRRGLP